MIFIVYSMYSTYAISFKSMWNLLLLLLFICHVFIVKFSCILTNHENEAILLSNDYYHLCDKKIVKKVKKFKD